MATSGTTAWSMTAQEMIVHALRKNSIISLGESPTTEEVAECLIVLNGILRSMSPGMYLASSAAVAVTANNASGFLYEFVSEVLSARLAVATNYERPLTRWGRSEYLEMPNKAQVGDPVAFYADCKRDAVELYMWPVPSRDITILIEYNRAPETVTDAAQTVDFPEKYNELLFSELAMNCAGIFGREPPPLLVSRTDYLRGQFEDNERPESYIIESGLTY